MKVNNKTYRFRILPNKEQEVLLNKHFGCSRFVYNYFLNERKEQYQKDKKSDRDVNASRNILKEGLKISGRGLASTKVERKSDVSNNTYSMKPEAHPIILAWEGSSQKTPQVIIIYI